MYAVYKKMGSYHMYIGEFSDFVTAKSFAACSHANWTKNEFKGMWEHDEGHLILQAHRSPLYESLIGASMPIANETNIGQRILNILDFDKGIKIVETPMFWDSRGVFSPFFKMGGLEFMPSMDQINVVYSIKHTIRGFHTQAGQTAQDKLVVCLSGKIQDVAVDLSDVANPYKVEVILEPPSIEKDSQVFQALFIPKTCAHAYYAMEDSIVMYVTKGEYSLDSEMGIYFNDPHIGVEWLFDSKNGCNINNLNISSKDVSWPSWISYREYLKHLEGLKMR